MGSYYKQQLNDWKATLDVNTDVVFDVGGAQDPITRHIKNWNVKEYKIVDLAVPHVLEAPVDYVQDFNEPLDLKTGITKYKGKVDTVFVLGVMDYIINPNIAMNNIYELLSETGSAWVEFPFVYPIHNPVDDEGCRYSEGCVRRLAKQANLKVNTLIYKTPKPGNRYLLQFYAEDGMRSARGVDHNVIGYIVELKK